MYTPNFYMYLALAAAGSLLGGCGVTPTEVQETACITDVALTSTGSDKVGVQDAEAVAGTVCGAAIAPASEVAAQ